MTQKHRCPNCGKRFDYDMHGGSCPKCGHFSRPSAAGVGAPHMPASAPPVHTSYARGPAGYSAPGEVRGAMPNTGVSPQKVQIPHQMVAAKKRGGAIWVVLLAIALVLPVGALVGRDFLQRQAEKKISCPPPVATAQAAGQPFFAENSKLTVTGARTVIAADSQPGFPPGQKAVAVSVQVKGGARDWRRDVRIPYVQCGTVYKQLVSGSDIRPYAALHGVQSVLDEYDLVGDGDRAGDLLFFVPADTAALTFCVEQADESGERAEKVFRVSLPIDESGVIA